MKMLCKFSRQVYLHRDGKINICNNRIVRIYAPTTSQPASLVCPPNYPHSLCTTFFAAAAWNNSDFHYSVIKLLKICTNIIQVGWRCRERIYLDNWILLKQSSEKMKIRNQKGISTTELRDFVKEWRTLQRPSFLVLACPHLVLS